MNPRDPKLTRLIQAAALLRDQAVSRLGTARNARAECAARLASFDPPPLDSADAELQRAAQRHAVWAELQRHRLNQSLARHDAELEALKKAAARAEARCQVLDRQIIPPRDQLS